MCAAAAVVSVLQFSWPEFVGADLSKVTLMEALSGTTWDKTKRTMFIIEGLVSVGVQHAVGGCPLRNELLPYMFHVVM
jgi:hypothetical protein